MANLVYLLCALMSTVCAILLVRNYKGNRTRLLLWSGICFGGLALSNIILAIDLVILPEIDFDGSFWRSLLAAVSGSTLLYGLIWEA